MYLPSGLVLLLAAAGVYVNAQGGARLIDCYGYSGRVYANNTRCPGSNACCDPKDECLSNRLCHRANDGPGTFVRAPCAVNPYDSGTCAQICLYNETGILPRVRVCADGSLCCDNDERCCDKGDGIFLDNEGRIADSPPSTTFTWGPERTSSGFRTSTEQTSTSADTTISSSSSSSVASSSTTDPDSNTKNNNEPDNNEDNDDGNSSLPIGLGVGLGVGIPLIAAAFGLWFCLSRKRRRSAEAQQQSPITEPTVVATPPPQAPAEKYQYTGRVPHEMMSPGASEMGRSELSNDPLPVEADGRAMQPHELDASNMR